MIEEVAALAHELLDRPLLYARATAARVLWRARRYDAALALTRAPDDDPARPASVFCALLNAADQIPDRIALLSEAARSAARAVGSPPHRGAALVELAHALFVRSPGDARSVIDEAIELATTLPSKPGTTPGAETIMCDAAALVDGFDHGRADVLFAELARRARPLTNEFTREPLLADIARALARCGRFDAAFDITNSLGRQYQQFVLIDIAGALAHAGDERTDSTFDLVTDSLLEDLARVEDSTAGQPLRLRTGHVVHGSLEEQEKWTCHSRADVVEALARAGRFEKARSVAARMTHAERRARAEGDLVAALGEARRLDEAIESAQRIGDSYWRAVALRHVAGALAKAGDPRATAMFEAAQAVDLARENRLDDKARAAIAVVIARAGRVEVAIPLAHRLPAGRLRASTLCSVAAADATPRAERERLLAEAEREALAIPDLTEQAHAVCDVASSFGPVDRPRTIDLVEKAAASARSVQDINRTQPARALRRVAEVAAQVGSPAADALAEEARTTAAAVSGYVDWAEELAEHAVASSPRDPGRSEDLLRAISTKSATIEHTYSRNRCLAILAAALARVGRLVEAAEVASKIPDAEERGSAELSLVRALAGRGSFDEAGALARRIDSDWRQAEALAILGASLASTQPANARTVLDEAAARVDAIGHPGRRPHPARVLADAFAAAGLLAPALAALGPRSLSEFVAILAQWSDPLERVRPGLSYDAVRAVIRIFGWIGPEFAEVDALM